MMKWNKIKCIIDKITKLVFIVDYYYYVLLGFKN